MTKKSEPEKSEEGEAGKPAARKGAVRKTIRRVRKAAPRREKISGNEEESHPKEVVIPIVQTTEPETSKPDALDAPEPVEAD